MMTQSSQNNSQDSNPSLSPDSQLINEQQVENDKRWTIGVVVGIWMCLLLASTLAPQFSYNRWDNFEYHTTTVVEAHSQWLKGAIPFWNHYQHLGEPILANGQPSALYFPYTVLLALMRLLDVPDKEFPFVVVLSHLPIMGVGWFSFMRFLGIRASFAWLGATSISGSGYLASYSAVWIFVCPIFTWLPWILLGVLRSLLGQRPISGFFLVTFGLTAIALVGHPQFIAYAWIFVLLFSLLISHFWLRKCSAPLRLALPALSALLLSAPAILPIVSLFPYTARSSSFSIDAFLHHSATPSALLGVLAPVFRINNGFIIYNTSSVFYQGAWVIPALLAPVLIFMGTKQLLGAEKNLRRRRRIVKNIHSSEILTAALKASSLLGIIFLLFSLGKWGLIYRLTHWIPIWSSLRWPHKFAPFALVAIGLAATMALELYARNRHNISAKSRTLATCFMFAIFFLALLATGSETLLTLGGSLTVSAGLLMIPAVFWCHLPKLRATLLLAGFISTIGITVLTHSLDLKTYREEYGSVGSRELGIDTRYRVLPLSFHRWIPGQASAMQQHGLFQSATANGYYSLTGATTAMAPKWYLRYISSNVWGLIPKQKYNTLLSSHYLRSLNVRYLIVAKDDKQSLQTIERHPRYKRMNELERVLVYDDSGALPRAYFARETKPFIQHEFAKGLMANSQDLKTAFVEGSTDQQVWPQAKVQSAQWLDGGRVVLDVDAPSGGFLVISQTYFPQWTAFLDGKETTVFRVNGFVQGVKVYPGTSRVELIWKSNAFVLGSWLAAVGMILLIIPSYTRKRSPMAPPHIDLSRQ